MSGANLQHMLRQDMEIHAKNVTGTYTVRTGTPTYNGLIDNPVVITDPASSFTLTVPNGDYVGQLLFIVITHNTSAVTVTITTTTGTDYSGDSTDWVLICWCGSTNGWLKVAGTVT